MCFFKPKISMPEVKQPAVSPPPVEDLPTPEAPQFGGSDEEDDAVGSGQKGVAKKGKSSLKIKTDTKPKTQKSNFSGKGMNHSRY